MTAPGDPVLGVKLPRPTRCATRNEADGSSFLKAESFGRAPTRRRNQPQHGCQVHGEASMSSLPEPGKEAVRQERAINA